MNKKEKKMKKNYWKNVRIYHKYKNFFVLVEALKERNEENNRRKHELELNKKQESEIRHNKNIANEKEKIRKKASENQKKLMQKYVTFYWSRKGREDQKKEKFLKFKEKYEEKYGRLEQIEKNTEKKRKNLIKKLQIIEINQNHLKERDRQKFESLRNKRDKYINTCRENKKCLLKLIDTEKDDILEYQAFALSRKDQMDKKNKLKKENFIEKTIYNQLTFEKNLKPFYKKLDEIKSGSIIKKSLEQRRKIYRAIKRAEAEAKRKEEEERLLNQKMI